MIYKLSNLGETSLSGRGKQTGGSGHVVSQLQQPYSLLLPLKFTLPSQEEDTYLPCTVIKTFICCYTPSYCDQIGIQGVLQSKKYQLLGAP